MKRQPTGSQWDRVMVRLPVELGQLLRDISHETRKSVTLLIVEALQEKYDGRPS